MPEQPPSGAEIASEQSVVKKSLEGVRLPHPDAQFQGKNGKSSFEVSGTEYKVSIFVDGRNPSEWGLHSTILECSPSIIHSSSFPNLQAVLALSNALRGPLSSAIHDCLSQIGVDVRAY